MGNALGCSASGERLVRAAREGDVAAARMLLALAPSLARYSTFPALNSPLHFAATNGHTEIVMLLLENGADASPRNYCGQTAMMQACRHGHWEVVQTLLLFNSNIMRTDFLSGRTALHFAAAQGYVRCIRLLVADFIPSIHYEAKTDSKDGTKAVSRNNNNDLSSSEHTSDKGALLKFINKPAEGGITALHMAALHGHFDCLQLLLDLHANTSAVTFHYGSSVNLIGAGSTPLHYAACGGNIKCCQVLLARGASRLTLNCNGLLPLDIAGIWGRHWLVPLLSPNSKLTVPTFPSDSYLSSPLTSILNIARECRLQSSTAAADDMDACAVCLERACTVASKGCGHELCVKCALDLCSTSNIRSDEQGSPGSVPCPLCRTGIVSFVKLPSASMKEVNTDMVPNLIKPCMIHPCDADPLTSLGRSELHQDCILAETTHFICQPSCSPFPSNAIPRCSCNNDPCSSAESQRKYVSTLTLRSRQTKGTSNSKGLRRLAAQVCSGIKGAAKEHQ